VNLASLIVFNARENACTRKSSQTYFSTMLFAYDAAQARASAFKPTAALAERPKGHEFESTMRIATLKITTIRNAMASGYPNDRIERSRPT
jgi:hypothetical protein